MKKIRATSLSIIIDFMCLWLLKFTPSEISRAHAITIIHLVGLILRNKIFLECGKEKICSMVFVWFL